MVQKSTGKDENSHGRWVGGAFSLTLAGVLSQGINYGIHIALGRLFAPSLYGVFGIIVSTFSLLEVILRWGLVRAMSFHIARNNEVAGQVFKKSLGLQTVYSLACFVLFVSLSGRLAVALGDPGLASYFRVSSVFVLTFALVPVYSGLLNGLGGFHKLAGMGVIGSLARLLLVIGLLAAGMEIYGVIVAYTLGPLVAVAYGMWVAGGEHPGGKRRVAVKDIVAFAFPLFVSALAISLLMRLDLFMVQFFLADRVLTGLYASASALVKAPYFLSLGSGLVLFRVVAQLRASGPSDTREFISRCMRYYLLGLAPIPFILYDAAEEIVRAIFGSAYLPAAPPFRILVFCLVFMVLYNVVTTFIAAVGRPRVSVVLGLLLLPVQVFLVYQWIFAKGLVGVALATGTTWAIGTLAGSVYLWHSGHLVLPKWRTAINLGLACLASYYLALWVSPSGVWLLLVCPLIYCVSLVVLRMSGEIGSGAIRGLLSTVLPAGSHAQKV